MNLLDVVNKNYLSKNVETFPSFKSGDTISVSVRIKEGAKSRLQKFEGIVIAMTRSTKTIDGHFRVRKVANGHGVERVFPFHSPIVEEIKLINKGKTRRAKHFYLRDRTGKASRIATDYTKK